MTAAERWLAAVWPVVRARLPASPARVVEIGCGPLGGVVPMLRSSGYEAVGVDPQAPDGEDYRRIEFERLELVQDVDVVVAITSLHHVADPAEVVDRIVSGVASGGTLVVVEWAWEASTRRRRGGASSGSVETTKLAGCITAATNGRPAATVLA